MKKISVCTIIAKNYIALAKTLAQSFHKFHPQLDFRVLIVDPFNPELNPEEYDPIILDSPSTFIESFLLNDLAYSYEITEFSTALKPFYLEYLLEQGYEQAVYLDPDILIFQPLDEIFQCLEQSNILLIPHLLDPIPFDGYLPSEINILQSGAYNLGFIGIANNPETLRFLRWWKERLEKYCCIALEMGLFVDQKWIDLVPSIFNKVRIFTKRGYNVAYWNLNARILSLDGDTFYIDQEQLVFFHFSGFNPDYPTTLSKHQNRIKVENSSPLAKLLQDYSDRLKANNHGQHKKLSYGYGFFSNSVPFDFVARHLLKQTKSLAIEFPDPINIDATPSFFAWLNTPVKSSKITNYFYGLHQKRPDLEAYFPDVFNKSSEDFLIWIKQNAVKQGIDPIFVKAALQDSLASLDKVDKADKVDLQNGINVSGYLTTESGVGESARSYVAALKFCKKEVALFDFSSYSQSRGEDNTLKNFSQTNPHPINLICVNADQVNVFANLVGNQYFEEKYNVGHWAWELPQLPTEWLACFNLFNEIWVNSTFVYKSLIEHSPIPIVIVPSVVEITLDCSYTKADFGYSDREFVFLFVFDFFSIFQRKNPSAVVEAFTLAFPPNLFPQVRLVLKCINGDRNIEDFDRLKNAITDSRIKIMDEYLSKDRKNGLLSICDCYISLHRSEGFGITIAEAMYLEKPVIATGWSGNMDFMTVNNSFPVEYDLTELTEDYGPYKQGQVWAEPNVDHAASIMRFVFENPIDARKKAIRAASDMRLHNSPQAIASIIQNRLKVIDQVNSAKSHQPQELSVVTEFIYKRLETRVKAMETSKFWMIRTNWFKFKRFLKLNTDNE
jgi:glycosyltransferase involved in cell wall biosynthesis